MAFAHPGGSERRECFSSVKGLSESVAGGYVPRALKALVRQFLPGCQHGYAERLAKRRKATGAPPQIP